VEAFHISQSLTDEVYVPFRGGDAFFRFFLEGVQNIDGLRVADGVDRSPSPAFLVRNNLKYRAATKTPERLCRWIGFALLGGKQSLPDVAPNFAGETAQIPAT